MQLGHDDLGGGHPLLLVDADRDAAPVVGDGDEAVRLHGDLDPGRVAGERLVHGVVDHLGEEMVQRLLVGAADVHAGPAAHRLEAFEHLDIPGGVAGFGACSARRHLERGPSLRLRGAEQIVRRFGFSKFFQWFRHGFSCVARAVGAANRFP